MIKDRLNELVLLLLSLIQMWHNSLSINCSLKIINKNYCIDETLRFGATRRLTIFV